MWNWVGWLGTLVFVFSYNIDIYILSTIRWLRYCLISNIKHPNTQEVFKCYFSHFISFFLSFSDFFKIQSKQSFQLFLTCMIFKSLQMKHFLQMFTWESEFWHVIGQLYSNCPNFALLWFYSEKTTPQQLFIDNSMFQGVSFTMWKSVSYHQITYIHLQ